MEKHERDFISELFLSKDIANATIAAAICEKHVDDNPEDVKFKNFYLNKLSYWNRKSRLESYRFDITGGILKPSIKSKYLKGKQRWR